MNTTFELFGSTDDEASGLPFLTLVKAPMIKVKSPE